MHQVSQIDENMLNKKTSINYNLRKQILTSLDEMINKCEDNQINCQKICNKNNRNDNYKIGINWKNVEWKSSKRIQNRFVQGKLFNVGCEIAMHMNEVIANQQNVITQINQILIGKIVLNSEIKLDNELCFLACNQEQNMIVAGRGKDVVIFKQSQFQLIEQFVLQGHTDSITAAVIDTSSNIIITAGSSKDKLIKQWRKQENKWNCIQTINEHKDRITDLQLTKKQEQLVSASANRLIKIWKINTSNYQLQCIQTLNGIDSCVYMITISQDSMYMATSSYYQNYFNIYKNEQNQIDPWKLYEKIQTNGQIHRVYFTNTDELLIQQVNPPQLIVFQLNKNNNFFAIQEVNLEQSDNFEILFPVFQIANTIFLKNNKFVYIIKRLRTSKFFIQQILALKCLYGFVDCIGEGIILWNNDKKSLERYKLLFFMALLTIRYILEKTARKFPKMGKHSFLLFR